MIRRKLLSRLARAAAIVGAAAAMAGCISLFPKTDPVTLFRFGVDAPAVPAGEPKGQMFGVFKIPTSFSRPAATDQILTVTDGEVAYISDARWVSPAIVLFDEAVARAFDADPGPARLITRGEASRGDFTLKLDVRTFETQYVNGPKTAPEVVLSVRAVMTRNNDKALVGDTLFEARVPAGENRVSAIAKAYDTGLNQVLKDLLLWVNAGGAGPASRG